MYTHFIVGFPGESTLDFLKTVAAVRHFDYPIPFKYSSNKGAASSRLPQQKSNVVISLRYALLMAVINIVIFSKLITIPPDDEKC
jgi:tRNA A37 methylthiotransferase MiaB